MGFLDDVVKIVKDAGEKVIDAGGKVIDAHIAIVTAPAKIVIDTVTGKSIDKSLKEINEVVVDAVSATTIAANGINFFVIDLAKAIGGDDAAKLAYTAVAGNVLMVSLPDMIVKYLNETEVKPEDLLTLPFDVLLATALDNAAQSLTAISKPIPDMVKLLLKNYFSEDVLNNARYVIGKVGITLPEIINGLQTFMGNKEHAVTLPGVIVFSVEPDQSSQSILWWAHELQHIVQYNDLGVAEFAKRYLRNHQELENEADQKANSVKL